MTKEITKAIVLQEIQDKLKLRDFDPTKFLFDETVVPTYDIGQHLEEWWHAYRDKTITAMGPWGFHIVPENERWTVARYDVVFMSGVFTIAGAFHWRYANRDPTGASVYLDLTAAQNTSYHVEVPTPVVLQHNDEFRINVDGYTTPGTLRVYIDYKKEIMR